MEWFEVSIAEVRGHVGPEEWERVEKRKTQIQEGSYEWIRQHFQK
jgi:hypothetical protein